jgi:hypothetical protein
MRKNSKVILDAEEQLVFGRSLAEVSRARDHLQVVLPGCLLLDLLDAKISRLRVRHPPGVSPWGA